VTELPTPPSAQQLDPLLLHADEQAFLKLLGPPLITTPRSAKRVLNSYGLLLALEGRERRQVLIGPTEASGGRNIRPHRAVLTLLAIVVGAPDDAPEFFRLLDATATATPDLEWTAFLARRRGSISALVTKLESLTERAAELEDGRGLPDRLSDWKPWVVPCGRLSFATGRVVVRLGSTSTSAASPPAPIVTAPAPTGQRI
jgi:hypothetical protein